MTYLVSFYLIFEEFCNVNYQRWHAWGHQSIYPVVTKNVISEGALAPIMINNRELASASYRKLDFGGKTVI